MIHVEQLRYQCPACGKWIDVEARLLDFDPTTPPAPDTDVTICTECTTILIGTADLCRWRRLAETDLPRMPASLREHLEARRLAMADAIKSRVAN